MEYVGRVDSAGVCAVCAQNGLYFFLLNNDTCNSIAVWTEQRAVASFAESSITVFSRAVNDIYSYRYQKPLVVIGIYYTQVLWYGEL